MKLCPICHQELIVNGKHWSSYSCESNRLNNNHSFRIYNYKPGVTHLEYFTELQLGAVTYFAETYHFYNLTIITINNNYIDAQRLTAVDSCNIVDTIARIDKLKLFT